MALEEQFLQQIGDLTRRLNDIENAAKTNDEIPAQNPFNPNAKLRVTSAGTSYTTTIQNIIDAAVLTSMPYISRFVFSTGYLLTDNNLTVNAGWKWFITGTLYTNPLDSIINIPYAAEGYSRIDIIVATTGNVFTRIAGTESMGTPVAPEIPTDTLSATFLTVSENAVTEPEEPVMFGDLFVGTKLTREELEASSGNPMYGTWGFVFNEYTMEIGQYFNHNWVYTNFRPTLQNILVNGSNSEYGFYLGPDSGYGSYYDVGYISHENAEEQMRYGRNLIGFTRNGLSTIIVWDDPIGTDANTCKVRIKPVSDAGEVFAFESDLANKADLVAGMVPSSQLPSYIDDVVEGYKSGGVFYLENTHLTPITGAIGAIYVDLTTGQSSKQYRYSGSAYIQITNGLIGSTNDVPEGTNLYYTNARVLAAVLTGISFVTGGAIVSTDTVLQALGKLQKQLSDIPLTVETVLLNDNTDSSIVTGVTTATLVKTIEIPANTFASGEDFIIDSNFDRTATAVSQCNISYRINTSNTLVGATQIAVGAFGTSGYNASLTRTMSFKNGSSFDIVNQNNAANNDLSTINSASANIPYSVGTKYYLFIIITPFSTSDSFKLSRTTIKKRKSKLTI